MIKKERKLNNANSKYYKNKDEFNLIDPNRKISEKSEKSCLSLK
jgi:hypothetical protein